MGGTIGFGWGPIRGYITNLVQGSYESSRLMILEVGPTPLDPKTPCVFWVSRALLRGCNLN